MNTNIIELREANATSKSSIGDYSITLNEKLLLEEGDELNVKQAYIDTRSNNSDDGRIKIDETNDKYDMNHIIYFTKYSVDAALGFDSTNFTHTDATEFAPNPAVTPLHQPDMSKYVLSYKVPGPRTDGMNVLRLTEYKFLQKVVRSINDLDLHIFLPTPKSPGGESIPVRFPAVSKHGQPSLQMADGSPLRIDYLSTRTEFDQADFNSCWDSDNRFKLNNSGYTLYGTDKSDPDDWPPFGAGCLGGLATIVTHDDAYHPVEFNVQFDIPHGLYEPSALAKLITDKCSKTKMQGSAQAVDNDDKIKFTEFLGGGNTLVPDDGVTTYPTKTPYFTSIKQLQADNNFGMDQLPEIHFMRVDTFSYFTINRASVQNFVLGASDVALTYDDTLNKFVFQSLHSPIILSDDSEGIVFDTDGNPGRFVPADAHSGIAFTGFGSDHTAQVTKLFQQNFGFDNSLFASVHGNAPRDYGPDTGGGVGTETNVLTSTVSIFAGKQSTGALISTDAFFSKKHNSAGPPAESYAFAFPMVKSEITTLNVNFIVGEKTLVEAPGELSNAYFLIEIGGLPTQKISYAANGVVGESAYQQTIKSIVGRYYQTSDYTQDQGAGSIPYIHKGQPTYIDRLNVRILSPNGVLSQEISDDNTVFLELVKRNQLPQIKEK